jgi:hypothetical protein
MNTCDWGGSYGHNQQGNWIRSRRAVYTEGKQRARHQWNHASSPCWLSNSKMVAKGAEAERQELRAARCSTCEHRTGQERGVCCDRACQLGCLRCQLSARRRLAKFAAPCAGLTEASRGLHAVCCPAVQLFKACQTATACLFMGCCQSRTSADPNPASLSMRHISPCNTVGGRTE